MLLDFAFSYCMVFPLQKLIMIIVIFTKTSINSCQAYRNVINRSRLVFFLLILVQIEHNNRFFINYIAKLSISFSLGCFEAKKFYE